MRIQVGIEPAVLVENTAGQARVEADDDWQGQSWIIWDPDAVAQVYLDNRADLDALTDVTGQGGLWDFSRAMLTVTLEPGEALVGFSDAAVELHALRVGR